MQKYKSNLSGDCLSIVTDGSDNQEDGLPYFAQVDIDTSVGHKFKVLCDKFHIVFEDET